MGYGKIFKCKDCGQSFESMMGIGADFSFEYSKISEDIKKGKYGEEFKNIMQSDSSVAVDLEKKSICL